MDKTFSHSALAAYIKKIHLERGSILISSNPEVLKQLHQMGTMPGMDYQVPMVFSADGTLNKASPQEILLILNRLATGGLLDESIRQELLELVVRIDEAQAVAEGIT